MENNRRDFLKLAGLTGLSIAGLSSLPACATTKSVGEASRLDSIRSQAVKKHVQLFNMNGYATSKINVVRIGIIGLGARGADTVELLPHIEGIDIRAVCDLVPEKAEAAKKKLESLG